MATAKSSMEVAKKQANKNPVQELSQSVCQRYGWSVEIEQPITGSGHDGNVWTCRVVVGLDDRRQFVATLNDNDDALNAEQRMKRGRAAAAQAALDGLRDEISRQEAKPTQTLEQVFAGHLPLAIYDSHDVSNSWDFFWSHKPTAVGIDTEGNRLCPPVLVQIATSDYCILEVPGADGGPSRQLSSNLQRLLNDETIVKVFCDNFSQSDKKCLGIVVDDSDEHTDWTQGHIVDVEAMAAIYLGSTKAARGLARILSLVHCTNVQIRKPATAAQRFHSSSTIQRFCKIEQGKAPPLQSLYELTAAEIQYAALDAWCTLLAYTSLCDYASSE